jgi:hypothetical protein
LISIHEYPIQILRLCSYQSSAIISRCFEKPLLPFTFLNAIFHSDTSPHGTLNHLPSMFSLPLPHPTATLLCDAIHFKGLEIFFKIFRLPGPNPSMKYSLCDVPNRGTVLCLGGNGDGIDRDRGDGERGHGDRGGDCERGRWAYLGLHGGGCMLGWGLLIIGGGRSDDRRG